MTDNLPTQQQDLTDPEASSPTQQNPPPPGESISFQDITVAIRRFPSHETFIAIEPPDAIPYVTVPLDAKPEEIVAFVNHYADDIRELREDMLKHFEKTKSLKCRFQTGDVAYLYGRPFMLRVYPVAKTSGKRVAARGRANVGAVLRHELSVIDLFLIKIGDYDQGRAAFMSLAKPIFERNAASLVDQCMARVFPNTPIPKSVKSRPLRNDWVNIDTVKSAIWISEALVPYPPECIVYAFLAEAIKVYAPEASETERQLLLETGLPNWQELRALLTASNSLYSNQN